MVKKNLCISRSFPVINVCNQGKTSCSPCTYFQLGTSNRFAFFIGDAQFITRFSVCEPILAYRSSFLSLKPFVVPGTPSRLSSSPGSYRKRHRLGSHVRSPPNSIVAVCNVPSWLTVEFLPLSANHFVSVESSAAFAYHISSQFDA